MKNMDDILSEPICEPVRLRPHHGMCSAYFAGYGYSDDFTLHMKQVLDYLKKDARVRLVAGTDVICAACPNNINGMCEKPDVVAGYDLEVLARLGIKEGDELLFTDFAAIVRERILNPGLRVEICGGCQWNEICEERQRLHD